MSSGRLTHATIRALDWLSGKTLPGSTGPAHQRIGRHGEEDAYFFLRKLGYVMVARNFRSPRRRGEIDLIGWDKDLLCFVEVKTRTTRDGKPAEAAAEPGKQGQVPGGARRDLHPLPPSVPVAVDRPFLFYGKQSTQPGFE